ncbi:MAG: DNA polymerase III subunit gamma/tau [Elusimicrobia bacterium]|jgi:DNA polymerase-3 subunit gamma/tau|nr:DNA polymerase III subunit gamma/tau [Elusimicrobiota bacterium]
MSYVVLARKYRPQKFSEVIGQEHITRTLQNAIKLNKTAHAYLFTGPRGIGKTSSARIFAKAVNCKEKEGVEPCNECSICREITSGDSLDVVEIDAASNTGVDNIRELRENVKFAPSTSKYKIYIIDEVHMLSKSAFNAILKTLEEPPSHVIFIMATTEPEKVLDTVVSRCQTFNFKLISNKKIMDTLKDIAEKEKIKYDSEGLWMIARAAAGSMRDAQSIMDQVLSYSQNKIDSGYIAEILGLIPREVMFEYSYSIKDKDVNKSLKLTEKLVNDGYNITRLFDELLLHFRNIMFAKVFKESSELMGFDRDYSDNLSEASKDFSKEHLVWMVEFIGKNAGRIKYSQNPQIVLDTVIFKLCQRFVSYDDILKIAGEQTSEQTSAAVVPPVPAAKESSPEETAQKKTAPEIKSEPKSESGLKPAAENNKEKEPVFEDPDVTPLKEKTGWDKVKDLLKNERRSLYSKLEGSRATINAEDKEVNIIYNHILNITDKEEEMIREKIKKVAGGNYRVVIKQEIKKKEKTTLKKKIVKRRITPSEIEEEVPVVESIIDEFGGKIERK